MYNIHEQANERQQAILSVAAEVRSAQRLRKLTRAARRADRAERQLTRSWHQAAQRQAELARLAADPWR